MHAEAVIGSPERNSLVAEAAQFGISYRDLTDAHLAIALITGRAYARHIVADKVENADGMSQIAVAALAYEGGAPSEPLTRGLIGLPELGDLGGLDAIEEIARLLGYFGRTTCSHPEGMEMTHWRNIVFDISVELQIGLGRRSGVNADTDFVQLQCTLQRLVAHFGHLWS